MIIIFPPGWEQKIVQHAVRRLIWEGLARRLAKICPWKNVSVKNILDTKIFLYCLNLFPLLPGDRLLILWQPKEPKQGKGAKILPGVNFSQFDHKKWIMNCEGSNARNNQRQRERTTSGDLNIIFPFRKHFPFGRQICVFIMVIIIFRASKRT